MKNKKYIYLLLSLLLSACQEQHDERYYTSHPQALEQALKTCSHQTVSKGLSCDVLREIYAKMRNLTYALRDDRLAYGRKILALQEQAGRYQEILNTHPNQNTLNSLKKIQGQIQEYLLPVMWFESPRNRA